MSPWSAAQQYPIGSILAVEPVGAAGFSGAAIYRVRAEEGAFALKVIPPGLALDHLAQVHRVLRFAWSAGCKTLAAPLIDKRGETIVASEEAWFELSPWMPGRADFNRYPTTERLQSAMRELARFHRASRQWKVLTAESPGIRERVTAITRLADELPRLRFSVSSAENPTWKALFENGLGVLPGLLERLRAQRPPEIDQPSTLQYTIRDIWHDHLLFEGNEVTGIIDFHAMRVDSPWLDVVRLVGSLRQNGQPPFTEALAYYREYCEIPLPPLATIEWLHGCGMVLGFVQWIKWLYWERREFHDASAVSSRLVTIVQELHRLHEDETTVNGSATRGAASDPATVAPTRLPSNDS